MNDRQAQLLPPDYLDQQLKKRWEELAPDLIRKGMLTAATRGLLARYVIAEQEYLRAVQKSFHAIQSGCASDAASWSAAQSRFSNELASIERMFGMVPDGEVL